MNNSEYVITGLGVVAPNGIGKQAFWQSLATGNSAISTIQSFPTDKFSTHLGAEIKGFNAKELLGPKGLRNLDNSTLFLMASAKQVIEEAKLEITDATTDDFGVATGTTFPHLWSMIEFDREVLTSGLEFSNPALFPSSVLNAASSQVSIRFNIQGFNSTISTGYTSSLEALKYALAALETHKAKTILVGGVEALNLSLFFGFHKLGYMAGIKGEPLSCPFDKRRNGPILGEAAAMFCVESLTQAKKRGAPIHAKIKSVASYFDAFKIGRIHPEGLGLEKSIQRTLEEAQLEPQSIDYISSCANSSQDLDKIEVSVLKKIFGPHLAKIPVSSIKSMLGETLSASGALQIISSLGVIAQGLIPPTINYQEKDPQCPIDCVPNKAEKKDVKRVLVTSFGPGGYNSACVLERYSSE